MPHPASAIGLVQSQLYATEHAPPPPDELKKSAREYAHGLAVRGRPRVSADGRGLAVRFEDAASYGGGGGRSALPYIAWLFQDAMTAALVREIDGLRPHHGALTAEQERLAATRQKLESLERTEEALIEAAQASGFDVLRRPDADPRAVLGVAVAT